MFSIEFSLYTKNLTWDTEMHETRYPGEVLLSKILYVYIKQKSDSKLHDFRAVFIIAGIRQSCFSTWILSRQNRPSGAPGIGFNAHFREVLHRTPQEYRKELIGRDIATAQDQRKYIPENDEMIQRKLAEYTAIF